VLREGLAASLGPERFQREIRLVAKLQHPNIVSVYDSGEAAGHLWFTMPYVEGESLRAKLAREGEQPVLAVVRLLRDLADALSYAHGHQVVHRDLKPENVLVSGRHALVTDFGVAKALSLAAGTDSSFTSGGMAIGTPAYMAPEQAAADPQTDSRADLYALGVIGYEMLTGSHPFGGRPPQAMLSAHAIESPEAITRRRPSIPLALSTLLMRLLEKRPADRPQSADEVLRELDAAIAAPALGPGATTQPRLAADDAAVPGEAKGRPGGPRHVPAKTRMRRGVTLALGAIALAVVAFVAYRGLRRQAPAEVAGATSKSIAVLPFVDMSPQADQQYFSDGMTEELITALSKVSGLRVAARTSAFAFKGRNTDVREIGRRLDVATVLEGSVRRAGNRLRVSAQLIDARSGYHLWSDEYDRNLADVFGVQDELARAIAGALRIKLAGGADAPLVQRPTEDPEAHELYLRGRYYFNRYTHADNRRAIEFFTRALQRDSSYALAYAGLADAYNWLADCVSPSEAMTKAEAAALKAVALDSTLSEAHAALGGIKLWFDWDLAGAEREFGKALAINQNSATAHGWYAQMLAAAGRAEEAVREAHHAQELDPLARIIGAAVPWILNQTRQYDAAVIESHRLLALDPTYVDARYTLGYARVFSGLHREAVDDLVPALGRGALPFERAGLGYAYAVAGRRADAQVVLDSLQRGSECGFVEPTAIAEVYAGLGDDDQAFDWLDRALAERSASLVYLEIDPTLDRLRSDPRFTELVRRFHESVRLVPGG
jgi:serine/threonine-protein kinase